MKLEIGKYYKIRSGMIVRMRWLNQWVSGDPWEGFLVGKPGVRFSWFDCGRYQANGIREIDIVSPATRWDAFKQWITFKLASK